jgi:outer membrane lipoprotein-sorting protein
VPLFHSEGHRAARLRRIGLIVCLAAVVLSAFSSLPAEAQALNPRALLQKVSAAYQRLNTYDGTASVEISAFFKEKMLQTRAMRVEMKMKRPNKLRLDFTMPTGTQTILSDGTNLFIYLASTNQYARYPTAPTIDAMLFPLLAVRAGVQASLDPLYFLGKKQLPAALTDLRFQGSDTYNGKPVFVVSGVITRPRTVLRDKKGHQVVLPPSKQYWTWWINKQTSLLEKIEQRVPDLKMTVPARQGKKVTAQQIPVTQRMRHVVLTATANPSLADSVFTFTPPPGAVEVRTVKDILQSGR